MKLKQYTPIFELFISSKKNEIYVHGLSQMVFTFKCMDVYGEKNCLLTVTDHGQEFKKDTLFEDDINELIKKLSDFHSGKISEFEIEMKENVLYFEGDRSEPDKYAIIGLRFGVGDAWQRQNRIYPHDVQDLMLILQEYLTTGQVKDIVL